MLKYGKCVTTEPLIARNVTIAPIFATGFFPLPLREYACCQFVLSFSTMNRKRTSIHFVGNCPARWVGIVDT